jgi:hypothetical protein
MQFYTQLKARGWERGTIEPMFATIHKQMQSQPEQTQRETIESNL